MLNLSGKSSVITFLVMMWIKDIPTNNGSGLQTRRNVIQEGVTVIEEFYRHYSTKQVDLVFVLDRSASVPRAGWASMVNFIRSLLQQFTVDGSNTRVAVITYSTTASVDINDLGNAAENKCSLIGRLKQRLSTKIMSGYTATYQALSTAATILYDSRTEAKKAVFVLTDGKSNIGHPPIRSSIELRSLQWNATWNSSVSGPQLEIYAFGIQDAHMPELLSVASPLPNHTYFIPDFQTFEEFAKKLHSGKQHERWQALLTNQKCEGRCSEHAICTCGTKSGDYLCVCKQGYQGNGVNCQKCPRATYKDRLVTGRCQRCPENSTTIFTGASDVSLCTCQPPYHRDTDGQPCLLKQCNELPNISHGHRFEITGHITDERPDTGQPCMNSPGDSCHYRCELGFRLSGHPGLVCEPNGTWTGDIPECKIVDCQTLDYHGETEDHGVTQYLNGSTVFGSIVQVVCDAGWRQFGDESRTCILHGLWSGTRTWCIEARCPSLQSVAGGEVTPSTCIQTQQHPGHVCSYRCHIGFRLHGSQSKRCDYHGNWDVKTPTWCEDVLSPVIECPSNITTAATRGNVSVIYWEAEQPVVTDNSGRYTVQVIGAPAVNPYQFALGLHQMRYTARDPTGNQASCIRRIHIVASIVHVHSCPSDLLITDVVEYEQEVRWPPPVFFNNMDQPVNFRCSRQSGSFFSIGTHNVFCYPVDRRFSASCSFSVELKRKECVAPPPPQHGGLSCHTGNRWLMLCSVYCNENYDFHHIPQDIYMCGLDGRWNLRIPGRFWPDCSRVHHPGRALMQGKFRYHYYSGDCDKMKSKLSQQFQEKVQQHAWNICGAVTCDIQDVHVKCGEDSRRKKRDIGMQPGRGGLGRGVGHRGGNMLQPMLKPKPGIVNDIDGESRLASDTESISPSLESNWEESSLSAVMQFENTLLSVEPLSVTVATTSSTVIMQVQPLSEPNVDASDSSLNINNLWPTSESMMTDDQIHGISQEIIAPSHILNTVVSLSAILYHSTASITPFSVQSHELSQELSDISVPVTESISPVLESYLTHDLSSKQSDISVLVTEKTHSVLESYLTHDMSSEQSDVSVLVTEIIPSVLESYLTHDMSSEQSDTSMLVTESIPSVLESYLTHDMSSEQSDTSMLLTERIPLLLESYLTHDMSSEQNDVSVLVTESIPSVLESYLTHDMSSEQSDASMLVTERIHPVLESYLTHDMSSEQNDVSMLVTESIPSVLESYLTHDMSSEQSDVSMLVTESIPSVLESYLTSEMLSVEIGKVSEHTKTLMTVHIQELETSMAASSTPVEPSYMHVSGSPENILTTLTKATPLHVVDLEQGILTTPTTTLVEDITHTWDSQSVTASTEMLKSKTQIQQTPPMGDITITSHNIYEAPTYRSLNLDRETDMPLISNLISDTRFDISEYSALLDTSVHDYQSASVNIEEPLQLHTLTIIFHIQADSGNDTMDGQLSAYDSLTDISYDLLGRLSPLNLTIDMNGTDFKVYLDSDYGNGIGEFQSPVPDCRSGYIEENLYPTHCIACPRGTYHAADTQTCELCPLDHYQDEEAMESCHPCSNGTSTATAGSKNITDCRAPCRRGHSSPSGLGPCTQCDIGHYQNETRMSECHTCPNNTTSATAGAEQVSQCKAMCSPGSYSHVTGLEPCITCPINMYQPEEGATHCLPCLPQTAKDKNCTVTDFCSSSSEVVCQNGGTCISNADNYSCICPEGFTGQQCQTDLDNCDSNPCFINSTCMDRGNNYSCICSPGYTGQNCDVEIDECNSSPCQHGGSCRDVVDGYQCYCIHGYNGTNCELVNECSSYPCLHGDCLDLEHGYRCSCHHGFMGDDCRDVDYCASGPCSNGGTCRTDGNNNIDAYHCSCLRGWTGQNCESAVREPCDMDYCSGQGDCLAVEGRYVCRCWGGFTGAQCQEGLSPEFDLVFETGSIMDYVSSPLRESLPAVTVCMWMRSHDLTNSGTLFSYVGRGANTNFTLSLLDYGGIQVLIGSSVSHTNIVLNDGQWHHICLTWQESDGQWKLYINGSETVNGNMAARTLLPGGGNFVIGQSQGQGGLISNSWDSYIGEISRLNVYDSVLDYSTITEMANQSQCNTTYGNVIAWTSVVGWITGHVTVRYESHCLDTNECLLFGLARCGMNRQCQDLIGSFKCGDCVYGYEGENCDEPINECDNENCQNEAVCEDGPLPYDYRCRCSHSYTGRHCEEEVNSCLSQPCLETEMCIPTPSGYQCLCHPSIRGDQCVASTCMNNTCQNGGICITSHGEMSCICSAEFTGTLCEFRIDFCDPNPCRHNGNCSIIENGSPVHYKCSCPPSWKGENCDIAVVPSCDLQPCLNGGTCVDADISGYRCLCPSQAGVKFGPNCEKENACSHSPCRNGGECVAIDDTLNCVCPAAFTGERCDVEMNGVTISVAGTGTTSDGATVFLECEEFDTRTELVHHQSCLGPASQTHCYASWKVEDGEVKILAKGCSGGKQRCYSAEECVGSVNKGVWFCCCQRSMCNAIIGAGYQAPDLIPTAGEPLADISPYLIAGLVVAVLGFLAVLVWLIIRIRRPSYRKATKLLPQTLNNSNDVVLQMINNPVFSSGEHSLPGEADNVYAELDILDPYHVTTKSDLRDDNFQRRNSSRYSSKRSNKECNIERAAARKNSDISDSAFSSKRESADGYMTPISVNNGSVCLDEVRKDTNELLPVKGKYGKPKKDLVLEKYMLPQQSQSDKFANTKSYANVNETTQSVNPTLSPGYINMNEGEGNMKQLAEYLEVLPPKPEDFLPIQSTSIDNLYQGDISRRQLPPVPSKDSYYI